MAKARPVLDSIPCPGCGAVIPVSDMIYHQVADQAEQDLKAKAARQERALADKEQQLQAREEAFDQCVQDQVKTLTARPETASRTASEGFSRPRT